MSTGLLYHAFGIRGYTNMLTLFTKVERFCSLYVNTTQDFVVRVADQKI